MNKQGKMNPATGKITGGIEWVTTHGNPDQYGYTWNPVSGCAYGCRWLMPNGNTAVCYAKTVAEGIAQSAYPDGFAMVRFHPERLFEPTKLLSPARIFVNSMSDFMSKHISLESIEAILHIARLTPWHTYLTLTKNSSRLLNVNWPTNVHVGVSVPPDTFAGAETNRPAMLQRSMEVLNAIRYGTTVRWVSFEPLSWDCADMVALYEPLNWAVIGAASNGREYYQPNPEYVRRLLAVLDSRGVPVFFKGNLRPSLGIAFDHWRENYPVFEKPSKERTLYEMDYAKRILSVPSKLFDVLLRTAKRWGNWS